MQKPLFMLGWGLLAAAFGAAALESMAPVLGVQSWPLISAKDLWYTVYPADYVIFKSRVQEISPFLWNPVMETALWPPAWALLAAPGVWLTWRFRPNKILRPDQEQEIRRQSESLFLFDELSRAAAMDEKLAADGPGSGGDDREPSHFVVEDTYEAAELESWDNSEGAPPDAHGFLEELESSGVADLTGGDKNAPVIHPVFQVPPPPPDENPENPKNPKNPENPENPESPENKSGDEKEK